MNKLKKIFTNVRVIIVLIAIILSIVAISPNFAKKGVAIRNIMPNSAASLSGIENPRPTTAPMKRERILSINNVLINTVADYYKFLETLQPNMTLQLKTNKGFYKLTAKEETRTIELNETVTKTINETIQVNETINNTLTLVNKTITNTFEVPKTETIGLGVAEDIGLDVYEAPTTNIRKGLDLQGGVRILLKPEKKLSENDMDFLLAGMKERLNVYGLSDLIIRQAGDLSGNQFILVEIAGGNDKDVEALKQQGKFEAKIEDDVVFRGGNDIKYVCRSADCAGIDPATGCSQSGDAWFCNFRFSITLSQEAAQKQADLTKDLDVVTSENKQQYLSKKLTLYLDNQEVDELSIGADLKGRAVTDIQISGSGIGITQQEAAFDALNNMKRLQTILITGSLPVKLEIIKTDSISPVLGEEFVKNALFIGLLSFVIVAIIIFIRYRKLKISIPILATMIAELLILLGVAALIGWNLDLAAIAGIIVVIGTGVNDQVVISDEILRGEKSAMISGLKERIKRAFSIIMAAYFTIVVAMVPLFFAGAGLLKGFALTTMIGVSAGVFITRPAYASVIEILLKE